MDKMEHGTTLNVSKVSCLNGKINDGVISLYMRKNSK